MLEERLQQFGTKVFINVMTISAGFIESFFKNLDEYKAFSYYADVIKNDINHEGQVGIMSFDDINEAQLVAANMKAAFNLPCLGVETKTLEAKIQVLNVNGQLINLPFQRERAGKITVFFPANAANKHMTKEEVRETLNYYAGNTFMRLRKEDLEFLPPGATFMDLVLANAHLEEFRAYYHIQINENEKEEDKEKEDPEEEEELEPEIGDSENEPEEDKKEDHKEESQPEEIIFPENSKDDKKKNNKKAKKKKAAPLPAAGTHHEDYKPCDPETSQEEYHSDSESYEEHSSYDRKYEDERQEELRREELRREEEKYHKEADRTARENREREENARKENTASGNSETYVDNSGNRTDRQPDSYVYKAPDVKSESNYHAQQTSAPERHEESQRVGGMSTEGNLYGDSLRRDTESQKSEEHSKEQNTATPPHKNGADHPTGTERHIDNSGNRIDASPGSYVYKAPEVKSEPDSHAHQASTAAKYEESQRVGGMKTGGNLYGDSLKKNADAEGHTSAADSRNAHPQPSETPETGRRPELNRSDPRFDEIRRQYDDKLNGIRRPEDNNKDPKYEHIRKGEGIRRPQDNNLDPRFEHIRKANAARSDMIGEYYTERSSNDSTPKKPEPEVIEEKEEKHERGSFTYGNENASVYQIDDTVRQHIANKSGRHLDGTDEPDWRKNLQGPGGHPNSQNNTSTQKSYGHGRRILFDTHDNTEDEGPHGKRKAAKDVYKSKAKAFTKPIKEALEEAILGDSEGGNEGRKYARNSAPVADYLKNGFKYGLAVNRAKETMHDQEIWAKAFAASRGEVQSETAKSIIKKELEKAGLNEHSFDGMNIVDVHRVMDEMQASKSALALMSDKDLKAWLSQEGKDLPEGLKKEIGKYREQIANAKSKKQFANASGLLTDAATSTRLSLQALKEEIAKFEKEAPLLLRQVTTLYELSELLKEKGYSEEFIKAIRNIPFMDMKNGDIAAVLKKYFELDKMDDKIKSIDSLLAVAFEGRLKTTGQYIMSLTDSQLMTFLTDMGLSEEAKSELVKMGIASIKQNPEKLGKLIKKLGGKDAEILKTLQNLLRDQQIKPSSFRNLGSTLSQSALRTAFGQSEGANALWENLGYGRNTMRITSTGIKISMKISGKVFGENAALTRGLRVAAHPIKHATGKLAASTAGKAVQNTRFARGLSKGFRSARRLVHAPGRFVGAHTRMAARGLKNAAVSGAKHVVMAVHKVAAFTSSLFSAGGSAAAGSAGGAAAAGGIAAGGWIIIIVLILALIILAVASQKDKADSVGNYQYTQFDADFQTEILNELQNLNDSFEEEVNRAATDRTYWSTKTGFSETDSVTHFESGAYSVYFRDDQGNELDHLDINNSKAILDMAAQYCKYTDWAKPSENASEDIKLAYEQIKQYYLDYCKFLWVSTHRITLEEYRPGDENHAEDDRSGLTTDSQGICPKNGTQVWLDPDFAKGTYRSGGVTYECGINNGYAGAPEGVCDPVPFDDNYTDYGEHAICSHPEEGRRDGWSVVKDEATGQPITRTHYICPNPNGHKCYYCREWERDDDGGHWIYYYHNCGEICPDHTSEVFCPEPSHKHTDYLWEYHCGGHMGAVVYVTIGDVSRLESMNPAKDIDVNDLSNYPDTSNDVYDYLETVENTEE